MRPLRVVLVATDFSPASAPAFELALHLAARDRARLLVVHAWQERHLPEAGYASVEAVDGWERSWRKHAEAELAPLLARAREEQVEAEPLLVPGFPDEAVVEAARRHDADLIVVGTHGRRGAARLFLGSVAARVVATAGRPVLTVPSRRAEQP